MGISLKDLGSFATGAIERDRELTSEKFAIRADELKANRDMVIAMKKDKYAADIAEYKIENEKAKEIKSLNATASTAAGKMSNESYAKRFLLAELGAEKYKILKEDDKAGFEDMIANYAALGARKYNNTIDRESLDTNFKADAAVVAKTFANELEAAKGDSFLINKILRRKSNVESNLSDVVEEKINASKKVVDRDEVDINKIQLAETKKRLRTPPEPFQTAFIQAFDKVKFTNLMTDDNFKAITDASSLVDFKEGKNWKFNKTDNKIDGLTDSSQAFVNSYQNLYNQVAKDMYDAEQLYNFKTKNKADLTKIISRTDIEKEVRNILISRQAKIPDLNNGTGFSFGSGTSDLVSIIPLNIMDKNNILTDANGKQYDLKGKLYKVQKVYKKFLQNREEFGNLGKSDLQHAKALQAQVEGDKKSYTNSLKEEIIKQLELNKTSAAPIEGSTPKETIPETPIKKSGTSIEENGIADGAGELLLTWKQIEDSKQIDRLKPEQKIAYDNWKAKQTPTSTNIEASPKLKAGDISFKDMTSIIENDITGKKKLKANR
jgi:hypothetical protein